jgi:hypothetical protein
LRYAEATSPSPASSSALSGASPAKSASSSSRRAVAPGELDDVRAAVLDAVGYRARFTHFPLAGLCPACAAKGGG